MNLTSASRRVPETPDGRTSRSLLILLLLIAIYLIAVLPFLSRYPAVTGDEPWIAAAAYKLATTGHFGSDLFAGFAGSERHIFSIIPLYSLLLAALLHLFGIGVLQLRALPVLGGLGMLIASFSVARRLFDDRVAGVSATLLVLMMITTTKFGAGIPLLNLSRIGRPETLTAAIALTGYYAFERADRTGGAWRYLGAGLLFGIASISHVVAVLWLPSIALLLVFRHGVKRAAGIPGALLCGGFLLPWIPVWIYLMPHLEALRAQLAPLGYRFGFFSARFYVVNLAMEIHRFGRIGLIDRTEAWRPVGIGPWIATIMLPPAIWCALRGLRGRRAYDGAATIALLLLSQGVLLALTDRQKMFGYLAAMIPLALMEIAWLGWMLWDRWQGPRPRAILAMLFCVTIIEGGIRIAQDLERGRNTDSYDAVTEQLAAKIPVGARIIGPTHLWLGLRRFDFRTWLVPIYLTESATQPHSIPFDSALEIVHPQVLVIDSSMRGFFLEISVPTNPMHPMWVAYERYLERHHQRSIGTVASRTYGVIDILDVGEPRR